ncbi:MAG: thiamine-phosphate kinase [Candidatus Methanoperedens sp.]|nr:thiamine-phosphate kinase [Candidatus Methanoperedens sp.]
MKISEINERVLIQSISKLLTRQDKNIVVGAGEDDCAVLDLGGDELLLLTTDMLHRKTDFPHQMTGWQIGWMSVAVNLSDIASKGARPLGILMAMGLSPDTELDFLEDIIKGMDDCASKFNTHILGGDTDSHDELTMTGTALGLIKKDLLVHRNGAKPGDMVCVTGNLGSAGAAIMSLDKGIPVKPKILKALLEPVPRINEGIALVGTCAVSSMMDISDGLALSLHDIGRASNVGFMIYEERFPVRPEVTDLFKDDELLQAVIYTGGDFELLFTVPHEKIEIVRSVCPLTVIGEVIKKGIFIQKKGKIEELKSKGYEHFRKKV